MEALQEIGLLHKAFVSQLSKSLLFFLVPLLLLRLAFSHLEETLMPTIWHAFTGFFEAPSAFAFLLLNCLIVTIIASTKLERGRHEEAISCKTKEFSMEKGGAFTAENVIRRGIMGQSHNSSITNVYDSHMNEGKDSVHTNYKEELINEKKPIMRAYRRACTGSDKAINKHLSDLKEKKLMRGSFSFNITDRRLRQAEERAAAPVAAMTNPSSHEEVWAAIMLAKKSDDRMANYMQAADHCIKGTNYGNENQALSAVAAAVRTLPAAPTTEAPSWRPHAEAARITPPAAAAAAARGGPSDVPATAIETQEGGDDDERYDSELEELNRRAEQFIARFNHQMRLQRQESLQRKGRRHRPCNHDIQYANPLQLPAPGLLVG